MCWLGGGGNYVGKRVSYVCESVPRTTGCCRRWGTAERQRDERKEEGARGGTGPSAAAFSHGPSLLHRKSQFHHCPLHPDGQITGCWRRWGVRGTWPSAAGRPPPSRSCRLTWRRWCTRPAAAACGCCSCRQVGSNSRLTQSRV